jgi:molybdenum cofactor guanylyltransferase
MLGVVLAGGKSRRMGRDKAEIQIGGEPLWRRQSRVLAAAGASPVVVVRRPDQVAPNGMECWRDLRPAAGPLTGLEAALMPQTEPWVAVLAVDMPNIDARWFVWLRGFCRPGASAAAPRGGFTEPLAAIYPREALAEISRRLDRGELSAQDLVCALAREDQMTLVEVPAAEEARLRNLNTPEELAAWEQSAEIGD